MGFCLYIIICLCLLIVQSTLIPFFPYSEKIYDLLIPYVVYLSLFRPTRESLPLILLLGLAMDNLSGGPFGLFMTVYFWLYLAVTWLRAFMHASNVFLLPFVIGFGVLLENIVFVGLIAVLDPGFRFPENAFRIAITQSLGAVITSPFFLIFYGYLHKQWDAWIFQQAGEKER